MMLKKCLGMMFMLLGPATLVGCRPESGRAAAIPHAQAEKDAQEPAEAGDENAKPATDPLHLHVDAEAQEEMGLEFEPLETASVSPVIAAWGVVEADPSRSFTVRASTAGFLRAQEGEWPGFGAVIPDGVRLGEVEARLSPLEQSTLTGQRVEAEGLVAEIEAELAAARVSADAKKRLNADQRMVSDRSVEEAEAKVKSSEARLSAARHKAELLRQQPSGAESAVRLDVRADRGGQVVEVLASPGEVVESGQALLRVARFDAVMVRVDLPAGESWRPSSQAPRVWPVGNEDRVVIATPLSLAPQAGGRTAGESWLLTAPNEGGSLRPGAPVAAHLPQDAEPLEGVRIPRGAIVRYGGRTWVFIRGEEEAFERREVVLQSPLPSGWLATEGVSKGEVVVVSGAQMLLSEQLKAQIEAEEEASE